MDRAAAVGVTPSSPRRRSRVRALGGDRGHAGIRGLYAAVGAAPHPGGHPRRCTPRTGQPGSATRGWSRSARPVWTTTGTRRRTRCRPRRSPGTSTLAKRTGKAADDPRPRRARAVLDVLRAEGAPDDRGVPLLLRRCAIARAVPTPATVLSFAGPVSFSNAAALAGGRRVRPAGSPARRDRRAVPHPASISRQTQRALRPARTPFACWPPSSR